MLRELKYEAAQCHMAGGSKAEAVRVQTWDAVFCHSPKKKMRKKNIPSGYVKIAMENHHV